MLKLQKHFVQIYIAKKQNKTKQNTKNIQSEYKAVDDIKIRNK